MPDVPDRHIVHQDGEIDPLEQPEQIGMGDAKPGMREAEVSRTTRRKWAAEDRARDKKRIPVGFRRPEEDDRFA